MYDENICVQRYEIKNLIYKELIKLYLEFLQRKRKKIFSFENGVSIIWYT